MKLLWTGSWPWWAVAPLGLLLIGFSIWGYRQQKAPRPLDRLLPVLRSVAVLLLVLSLLQPVLARFFGEEKRGAVLVLVDNSGSMTVCIQKPSALVGSRRRRFQIVVSRSYLPEKEGVG